MKAESDIYSQKIINKKKKNKTKTDEEDEEIYLEVPKVTKNG